MESIIINTIMPTIGTITYVIKFIASMISIPPMLLLIIAIIAIIIIALIILVLVIVRRRRKQSTSSSAVAAGEGANNQIYVGNLSYQVTEQHLKEFFSQYGAIDQVRIVRNYSSGRSKGFGFVTYRTAAEANKSLVAHGEKYQGRTIVVRIAKPR